MRSPDHAPVVRAGRDQQKAAAEQAVHGGGGVFVAGAHLGAAVRAAAEDHVMVITSDPGDMRTAAEGRRADIVPL